MEHCDVAVLGTGPAGLAVAAELSERGLRVRCVSPHPDHPWDAVYGVWPASLDGLDLGEPFERRWEDAQAILDGKRTHRLGAPYAKLHNARIKARLEARIAKAGGTIRAGKALDLAHDAQGTTVRLASGESVRAALVIDATGADSRFVERERSWGRPTLQDTYGIMGRLRAHPFDPACMVLMDYRDEWLDRRSPRATTPTFLYAMPLAHDRLFVEETSLVQYASAAISTELMKARLEARLERLGIRFDEVEFVERGRIPMASPMPKLGQRVLAYGAAANMVHPATAWHVGLALKTAPKVAADIARSLGAAQASPDKAARSAWKQVWPMERRTALPIHLMGGAMLAQTTMDEQREFLDAFFRTAKAAWGPFATWELPVLEMQRALSPVMGAAPRAVKQRMVRAMAKHLLGPIPGLLRRGELRSATA